MVTQQLFNMIYKSNLEKPSVLNNQTLTTTKRKETNVLNDEATAPKKKSFCDKEIRNNVEKESTLNNKMSSKQLATKSPFVVTFEVNVVAWTLFVIAFAMRFYEIDQPRSIVFDELHYGRFVSLYLRRTFFFDSQPPLGKQLISLSAYLSGYKGQFADNFTTIGQEYDQVVPLRGLRMLPAVCGSLLVPVLYHLVIELGFSYRTATFTSILLILENSLLTQSRFILLDSILLLFSFFGILSFLVARRKPIFSPAWFAWLVLSSSSLTCGLCVKYIGVFTLIQVQLIAFLEFYYKIADKTIKAFHLWLEFLYNTFAFIVVPIVVYILIFYIHLSVLIKAGPHDNIMTSAFQASLEGGLASIIRGQPREIAHGSQITLRNTHGRTCWLHSHQAVYPIRYPDQRGSSHQQQVTCYSFKDVNNWWIVKRPQIDDLITYEPRDTVKDGDIIQIIHGLSGRALNSHDIAAPMSPYNQEVSCYIDYNISMAAQNLWKVKLLNPGDTGGYWHAINSKVQLIHVNSSQALKLSGLQLPNWGFHQHEVVTDKQLKHQNTIWNVEEHRYTKNSDEKELERELGMAEFVPLNSTYLSFWDKMVELQYKMLVNGENVQNHLYSTESPLDWVLLVKGIAYWLSPKSNAQIYLIGNIVIWYLGLFSIVAYWSLLLFYIFRRKRLHYDILDDSWNQYILIGHILVIGYLLHFVPYFLSERTLFLHHYLPALLFKIILIAAMLDHVGHLLQSRYMTSALYVAILAAAFYTFVQFAPLSYGLKEFSADELVRLKWRKTWHFLIHKH